MDLSPDPVYYIFIKGHPTGSYELFFWWLHHPTDKYWTYNQPKSTSHPFLNSPCALFVIPIQNFTQRLWISYFNLQYLCSLKFFFLGPHSVEYSASSVLANLMGTIDANIKATNKTVDQGRQRRKPEVLSYGSSIYTHIVPLHFGFNNFNQLWPPNFSLGQSPFSHFVHRLHYHKTPGMQQSHEWGNEVCPERLVLGGTKLSLRGHGLCFRALWSYLLNSLL